MTCKTKKSKKLVKQDSALQRQLRQGKITRSQYNKKIKIVQAKWSKEVKEKEYLKKLIAKEKQRRKK